MLKYLKTLILILSALVPHPFIGDNGTARPHVYAVRINSDVRYCGAGGHKSASAGKNLTLEVQCKQEREAVIIDPTKRETNRLFFFIMGGKCMCLPHPSLKLSEHPNS